MPDRFEKRLEHGPPIVTDGGMGVLVSSAVTGLRCPEEANIRAPDSVVTLHTSFISAGAELIETNTFGANRHKLRPQFLEDQLAAINESGVKLAQKLRTGEWVTCVELDPPKGGTYDAMLAVAKTLSDSGRVGFVDINDNPMARARANALMASVAIERSCGIETIPHVTPRDTSVMGLQSQLLGAHAEGVRNVLAVTGDPPHVGDY